MAATMHLQAATNEDWPDGHFDDAHTKVTVFTLKNLIINKIFGLHIIIFYVDARIRRYILVVAAILFISY